MTFGAIKPWRRGIALCLVVALAASHGVAQEAATPRAAAGDAFGVHGSNTIGARLMPSIIEAYAKAIGASVATSSGAKAEEVAIKLTSNDGITLAAINLHSHGSATAVAGLANGSAAIGLMSRQMEVKEVQSLLAGGLADMHAAGNEHVLALDGLLVVTAAQNPVASLTMDQIAGIFSGQISDWSALGGATGAIEVYARDDKSGTFDTFNSLVLKPRKLSLSAQAKRLESSEELSDTVAQSTNAIGFVGFAYRRNAKAVAVENDCGTTVSPTSFDIKTEVYPLARRLYLYAQPSQSKIVSSLVKFAVSPASREAVTASGFIDQEFEMPSAQNQTARLSQGLASMDPDVDVTVLKDMAASLKTTGRLSATLFFRDNSSELDNKALADVQRIARYLKGLVRTHPDKKIVLAGFADTRGAFPVNAKLALARAEEVRKAVLAAGGLDAVQAQVIAKGYSELLPLSCKSAEDGYRRNRRVEIWVE